VGVKRIPRGEGKGGVHVSRQLEMASGRCLPSYALFVLIPTVCWCNNLSLLLQPLCRLGLGEVSVKLLKDSPVGLK